MALDPSNGSNLEQLVLKGLTGALNTDGVTDGSRGQRTMATPNV